MCGRFVMLSAEEIADVVATVEQRSRLHTLAQAGTRTQAFPGSAIATIGSSSADDRISAEDCIWGFAPEWSDKAIFNTRIEKAQAGSGMWKAAYEHGRCIIPAASFFEPHQTETMPSPRTGRSMKRPYVFADPDGSPLLMAGLREDGRCSVVTTEPNRWVASVHNRMPLLLRFDEVTAWLDEGAVSESSPVFELSVRPEFPDIEPQKDQLTLF